MSNSSRNLSDVVLDQIKNLLNEKKISYEQLAKKTGIGKMTVYHRFRDKKFSIEWLESIASALDVDFFHFFGLEEENSVGKIGQLEDEIEALKSKIQLLQELNDSKDRTIALLEEKLENRS